MKLARLALTIAVLLSCTGALAQSKVALGYYKEGVALGNDNKIEEAIGKFQKAVAFEPTVFEFNLKLAYAYEMQGRLPEARAAYEAAIKIKSTPEGHRGLADVLRRTRFFEDSEKSYQKAMGMKRNYTDAMGGMALLHFERDELDKAAEMYLKVMKIEPKNADVAFKVAGVYFKSEKWDEAATWYRKAIELKPEKPESHYGLGAALQKKGDNEGAKAPLKKACEGGVKKACSELFKINN
jgi:superkiller protein 3